jgi:hypothetical protein
VVAGSNPVSPTHVSAGQQRGAIVGRTAVRESSRQSMFSGLSRWGRSLRGPYRQALAVTGWPLENFAALVSACRILSCRVVPALAGVAGLARRLPSTSSRPPLPCGD